MIDGLRWQKVAFEMGKVGHKGCALSVAFPLKENIKVASVCGHCIAEIMIDAWVTRDRCLPGALSQAASNKVVIEAVLHAGCVYYRLNVTLHYAVLC